MVHVEAGAAASSPQPPQPLGGPVGSPGHSPGAAGRGTALVCHLWPAATQHRGQVKDALPANPRAGLLAALPPLPAALHTLV